MSHTNSKRDRFLNKDSPSFVPNSGGHQIPNPTGDKEVSDNGNTFTLN